MLRRIYGFGQLTAGLFLGGLAILWAINQINDIALALVGFILLGYGALSILSWKPEKVKWQERTNSWYVIGTFNILATWAMSCHLWQRIYEFQLVGPAFQATVLNALLALSAFVTMILGLIILITNVRQHLDKNHYHRA
ncbi:MAG: hypothetical protein AAB615_00185 [Patescibacteria group bacterium]